MPRWGLTDLRIPGGDDAAIQGFGGHGYIDEYPVQEYLRDARVMTTPVS